MDGDDTGGTVGQVRSLHVDPEAVGRGRGRALLAAARERLRRAGHTEATLWVVADNERARAVYEADGWRLDVATRRDPLGLPGEDVPTLEVVRLRRLLG
jgi:GNAT superfamily N-acetyltransferase